MSSMNPAVPQKQWHGLAALAQQKYMEGTRPVTRSAVVPLPALFSREASQGTLH